MAATWAGREVLPIRELPYSQAPASTRPVPSSRACSCLPYVYGRWSACLSVYLPHELGCPASSPLLFFRLIALCMNASASQESIIQK